MLINIPRTITLSRQKLDRIERELRKVLEGSPENALNKLDLKYAISHIEYTISILRDIEKYIDDLNAGGV